MSKRSVIFTFSLIFILFFVVSTSIAGESSEGPYISLNGGVNWLTDADFDGGSLSSELNFDTGYLLGAAVGNDFGPVRLEGEFVFRSNGVDQLQDIGFSGFGFGDVDAGGDMISYSFLVNGFYDIETSSIVTPYVGGGAGISRIDIDDFTIGSSTVGDEDDTVIAYQFGGGLGFEVSDNFHVDIGYRFFATTEPEFDDIKSEYHNHSVILALRYLIR